MLTRYSHAVIAAGALLALASLSPAAEEQPAHPAHVETHQVTIDRQVEIAQSMADHEAVAERFDQEAAQFDEQAAEHERLAKLYRSGLGTGHMADHCDRIAQNLKASAKEAREMARMYRDVAHKLVK